MPEEVWRQLGRMLEGDRRAVAWLYDLFSPQLLRRLALRYPELHPEPLVQDTYLACLRGEAMPIRRLVERLSAEELTATRVEGFLWDVACGIASNRRHAARWRRLLPRAVGGVEAVWTMATRPEAAPVRRDLLERLDRHLREDSARLYLYFKLRYHDGLTPDQMARATGWSRRATYKLRAALDEAVREQCRAAGHSGRGVGECSAVAREDPAIGIEELLWELSRLEEPAMEEPLPDEHELWAYRRGELSAKQDESLERLLAASGEARSRLLSDLRLLDVRSYLRSRIFRALGLAPRARYRWLAAVLLLGVLALGLWCSAPQP